MPLVKVKVEEDDLLRVLLNEISVELVFAHLQHQLKDVVFEFLFTSDSLSPQQINSCKDADDS